MRAATSESGTKKTPRSHPEMSALAGRADMAIHEYTL